MINQERLGYLTERLFWNMTRVPSWLWLLVISLICWRCYVASSVPLLIAILVLSFVHGFVREARKGRS